MLDLRDLIIERIDEAVMLRENITTRVTNLDHPASLDSELRVNRAILKSLSKAKNKQKERCQREELILQEAKSLQFWHCNVLENFYSVCLAIFSRYDQSLLSLLENTESTSSKLTKLYDSFLKKEQIRLAGKNMPHLSQSNITNISPTELLGLISEWSHIFYMEKIQAAMNAEFDRHELRMKQISTLRSNIIMAQNDKIVNPLSFSTQIQRSNESNSFLVLTNKQSVYGLFIDEIIQYYKSLPLQLDFSFIKNIRKVHNKANEFEKEDNLQKAAQILIEAKNKIIKEQIQSFKVFYRLKHQICQESYSQKPKKAVSYSPKKTKRMKNISTTNDNGIERIKSESKQQQYSQRQQQANNRNSLLLSRKFKQISFDNSQLFRNKKKNEKKILQLPELFNHKIVVHYSKSAVARAKPMELISTSKNIVSETNTSKVMPKYYDFKQPYMGDKIMKKNNCSMSKQVRIEQENPEKFMKGRDGDQIRRNRKLMLQLLREKNRNSLFE